MLGGEVIRWDGEKLRRCVGDKGRRCDGKEKENPAVEKVRRL